MKYNTLSAGLSLLLFMGCSNNDMFIPESTDHAFDVMSLNTFDVGGYGNDFFQTGDEIGVFIMPENSNGESELVNFNNRMVYGADNRWESSDTLYWISNDVGSKVDLVSYYPYIENAGRELLPLRVRTDQRVRNGNEDEYLWGKTTLTKGEGNVPQDALMNHLTSMLVFHVRFSGSEPTGNAGIEELNVMSYADGVLNCLTGDVNWEENARSLIPYRYSSPEYGDSETYSCYIFPQKYNYNQFISFKFGEKNYSRNFTYDFEAGKVYQFTLNISNEPSLELDGQMPIEEWKTDTQYGSTGSKYKICDPWPDAENIQGYVMRVREGNTPGLIMGLPSGKELEFIKSDRISYIRENYIDELRKIDWWFSSYNNMITVKRLLHGFSDFPAYEYCDSLGGEWFIPSETELDGILYDFFEDYFEKENRIKWWTENISPVNEYVGFYTSTMDLYWFKIYVLRFCIKNETEYDKEFNEYSLHSTSWEVLPFRYY